MELEESFRAPRSQASAEPPDGTTSSAGPVLVIVLYVHLVTLSLPVVGGFVLGMLSLNDGPLDKATLDLAGAFMILGQLIVYVIVAISWGVWQYRMAKRVQSRGRELTVQPPIGGVVVWLIPAINLLVPYRVMRELYRATSPHADWTEEETPGRFRAWWAVSVTLGVLTFLVGVCGTIPVMLSIPVAGAADLLAIWLVRRMEGRVGSRAASWAGQGVGTTDDAHES